MAKNKLVVPFLKWVGGKRQLIPNSASNFIKEIYAEYNIHVVQASRAINSDSSKRGQVDEFLISNYE